MIQNLSSYLYDFLVVKWGFFVYDKINNVDQFFCDYLETKPMIPKETSVEVEYYSNG